MHLYMYIIEYVKHGDRLMDLMKEVSWQPSDKVMA